MIGFIFLALGAVQMVFGLGMMRSFEMLVFGIMLISAGYFIWKVEGDTPVMAFYKAGRKKLPIMEVERKDGTIEFEVPEYEGGMIKSEKYGNYEVDEEDTKLERKSRSKILHFTEGIGKNLTRDHINIIRALKNEYGIRSYNELMGLVSSWRKCLNKNCNFEGLFKTIKKEIKDQDGNITKKILSQCPKCQTEGGVIIDPPLEVPVYKNIEMGYIDRFFKENQNPIYSRINAAKMAQNEMDKEKSIPIGKIAMIVSLFIGAGICIFLVLIGAQVFLSGVVAPQAQAAAAAVPAIGG